MTETFTTRFKNLILFNSRQNIDLENIESIYTKMAPVKEMCALSISGMQGAGTSKVLWAIIQPDLDNFREFNEVNLRFVLQERFDNTSMELPAHQRLKGFTITLEKLPHTPLGRLDRAAIKKIYEHRVLTGMEGSLPVVSRPLAKDLALMESPIGQKVLVCLKDQCGIKRDIHLKDSLELDLGIDSLGRIELASYLEESFKVKIKDEFFSRAFSVNDLIVRISVELKKAEHIPLEDEGIVLGAEYWQENLKVLPTKENLELLELSTGYFAWLFRFTLTAIDCLFFKVFFNLKSDGSEHVPKEGAYILYGNHTSFLDGPAIGASLPRRPVFQIFYFVFGPYFFRPFVKNPILRNFVKMGRFIPFDFSTHFLEALRSSYYVLKNGKGLCFFPEGLRTSTGEVGEFRKGFGVLAKETGAKLVPVWIEGAHVAWPSTSKYPKRYPIRVRFGKPHLPEDLEEKGMAMGAKDGYEAISMAARKVLIELKERDA